MKPFFLCFYFSFLVLATQLLETSACTKEIRAWVDGHNSMRLQVASGKTSGQPSGSEMKLMIWDPELYQKARKWANNNRFKHNPDKTIASRRFTTGENLYTYSTTDLNYKLSPEKALESWFIEHRNYRYGPLRDSDFDVPNDKQIGHYTQMVWSDSIYVGCAISQYRKGKWNKFLVVCNYGPAGNVKGTAPYKRGRPSWNLTCGCKPNDSKCDCSKPYGGQC